MGHVEGDFENITGCRSAAFECFRDASNVQDAKVRNHLPNIVNQRLKQ